MSRRDVATALGISERTVLRHEFGDTPLSTLHRRAYADFYGVDIADIADGSRAAA